MNKKIFPLTNTLLIAGLLLLSACSGSEGPIGPQGATGPQGAAGPQGKTGTANVIYSGWITTSFTGSGSSYMATITAPAITQAVLDSADIRVYWKEGSRVLTLPYAQTIGSATYTIHQRFYVGNIELLSNYSLSAQSFRYVIIPGGMKAGRKVSVNLQEYTQVKQYYNLPD